jgi:hypothetical protein
VTSARNSAHPLSAFEAFALELRDDHRHRLREFVRSLRPRARTGADARTSLAACGMALVQRLLDVPLAAPDRVSSFLAPPAVKRRGIRVFGIDQLQTMAETPPS